MSPQAPSMQVPPRLPLVVLTSNRRNSTKKDARLVNCYIEVTPEQEIWIYRRPGLADFSTVSSGEAGYGLAYWEGSVFSIFGDKLYKEGVQVASGLDVTNGVYKFDFTLGANPKLVFGNGKAAYTYNDTDGLLGPLHSIDSDYPEETRKGFAYLNSTLYVFTEESDIWNSASNSVDQAGDWNAIDFISAQIESDNGVAMGKQLVYVVAFKQWSTEIFFDAGNPTGSPLGPVQGSKLSYGCASQDSIQRIDDRLIWLTSNQTASKQIALMEQLAVRIVSTPSIDKLLESVSIATVFSWQVKIDGHSFYVITFKASNLTLAYDIDEDLWHQWTDANGDYFPIVASTYNVHGQRILQHESNGQLYVMSNQYYTDTVDPIVVDIYTPNFDANTRRKKQMNLMEFIGDQVEGSVLQVRSNDKDYEETAWSQFRTVDLGAARPILTNCGTFRRRAYNFRHASNTAFRLQAVEVQYDIGTL